MRAALDKDGRLLSPKTHAEAVERLSQLQHECTKIEAQLADPRRRGREPAGTARASISSYYEWRQSAQRALAVFRNEEKQLSAWLAGAALLKEAHALLLELELRADPPLTDKEEALMDRLDDYFGVEIDTSDEEKSA